MPAELVVEREGSAVERLAGLEARIVLAVRCSRADATLVAYASDWKSFTTWCAALGLNALPATPATVAGFLVDLAESADERSPRRVSTLRRRLAAISEAHRMSGAPNPTMDPLVRETMSGLRRVLGVAPAQKKAVTTGDLRAVVAALGDRPIDRRDRCLLLLGYAGGFRRSELVALASRIFRTTPTASSSASVAPKWIKRARGATSKSHTGSTSRRARFGECDADSTRRASPAGPCCVRWIATATSSTPAFDLKRSPGSKKSTSDPSAISPPTSQATACAGACVRLRRTTARRSGQS